MTTDSKAATSHQPFTFEETGTTKTKNLLDQSVNSNLNKQAQLHHKLPTIRDSKTSGPVQRRSFKLSLDKNLTKLDRGYLYEFQPTEKQHCDAFEVFSFKQNKQVPTSFSSKDSIVGGKPNLKMPSRSSHIAMADAAVLSLNTGKQLPEHVEWIMIESSPEKNWPQTTKNKQASLIGQMDYHFLQHKLLTREAGATLHTNGLPFYLQEMQRSKMIKANKTHKLRKGLHSNIMQNMQTRCQPSNGSYILDRMNANQQMMYQYRFKNKLLKQPIDYITKLSPRNKDRYHQSVHISPPTIYQQQYTQIDKGEYSPLVSKQYSSQNIRHDSLVKHGSEHNTDGTIEKKRSPVASNEMGKTIHRQTSDNNQVSSNELTKDYRLPGRHKDHGDKAQATSVTTPEMSKDASQYQTKLQIGQESADAIKHLNLKESNNDVEDMSLELKQVIQDGCESGLSARRDTTLYNNIQNSQNLTQNDSPMMRGPNIVQIQGPISVNKSNDKKLKAQLQLLNQQSSDKKRLFNASFNKKGLENNLDISIHQDIFDQSLNVNMRLRHIMGKGYSQSPEDYQPIQLKIQKLSVKKSKQEKRKKSSTMAVQAPYKLDVTSQEAQILQDRGQTKPSSQKPKVDKIRGFDEAIAKARNQKKKPDNLQKSPSTQRDPGHDQSFVNVQNKQITHVAVQNNASLFGSNSIDRDSIISKQKKQNEKPQPVFVINKKPKSNVVNYKSSSGYHMVKISQGDPRFKMITSKEQLSNEKSLLENTINSEDSFLAINTDKNQSQNEKILFQNMGQKQSDNGSKVEKRKQKQPFQSKVKSKGNSELQKIQINYNEITKNRAYGGAKSVLQSQGSNYKKDYEQQSPITPMLPVGHDTHRHIYQRQPLDNPNTTMRNQLINNSFIKKEIPKQTDRTMQKKKESMVNSQMQNSNDMQNVQDGNSVDLSTIQNHNDQLSRGQPSSKENETSQNFLSHKHKHEFDATRNESEFQIKKEMKINLENKQKTELAPRQTSPIINKEAHILITRAIDISANKSSQSLISTTPQMNMMHQDTKLTKLLKGANEEQEMTRTFKLGMKDDDLSIKIQQSKTSQGHHMSPVNKAVLIKKQKRTRKTPNDSLEKQGQKRVAAQVVKQVLPAISYALSQDGGSMGQSTPENEESLVQQSIFDDEKHVNNIMRKKPPKYLGKGEFGTRYKFNKDIMSNKPNSVIKNEEKMLDRNQALHFSFQRASFMNGRNEKMNNTIQINDQEIKELQITGKNQVETSNKPSTALPTQTGQTKIINYNLHRRQNQDGVHTDNNTSLYNLKNPQQEAEANSTLRQENTNYSPVGRSQTGQIEFDPKIKKVNSRKNSNILRSPSCNDDESRYSSIQKNSPGRLDIWDPKMNFQNDPQAQSDIRTVSQKSRNQMNRQTTGKFKGQYQPQQIKNIRLRQISNENHVRQSPNEMRYKLQTVQNGSRQQKKPAELYSQFQSKQNRDKQRSGNPFKAVHKGLVASRNIDRTIYKLSNQYGSFANKDDIHVMTTSLDHSIDSINKFDANTFAKNLNMDSKMNSTTFSPNYSWQNYSIENSASREQDKLAEFNSLKSQNFQFNTQSKELSQNEAAQVILQTQNSEPTGWMAGSGTVKPQFQALAFNNKSLQAHNRIDPNLLNYKYKLDGQINQVVNPPEIAFQQFQVIQTPRDGQFDSINSALMTSNLFNQNYWQRKHSSVGHTRKNSNVQQVGIDVKRSNKSTIRPINHTTTGSRKLFTLPTTAVEDLRKQSIHVSDQGRSPNISIVSKQVDLKQNITCIKRKGGGLILRQGVDTINQAVGLDPFSNSITNEESADMFLYSNRDCNLNYEASDEKIAQKITLNRMVSDDKSKEN